MTAVHTRIASLAASDGWKLAAPTCSQRRAPFRSGAKDSVPGRMMKTSSNQAASIMGHASDCHLV